MVVAIDGPAGAGKSTVARALARELGFTYLDSGAMYRTVALLASGAAGAAESADAASSRSAEAVAVARDLSITLGERITANGEDVTEQIRTPEVSEAASRVATDPRVREALVAKQRELLADGDWVAEGRDIGTVVAPDAGIKIYLTADPEERARRRAAELGADLETVLKDQTLRDQQDQRREHSPLKAALDAVTLDTTGRSLDDVVQEIAGRVRAAGASRGAR